MLLIVPVRDYRTGLVPRLEALDYQDWDYLDQRRAGTPVRTGTGLGLPGHWTGLDWHLPVRLPQWYCANSPKIQQFWTKKMAFGTNSPSKFNIFLTKK